MTLQELAEETGIDISILSKVERGLITVPHYRQVLIARVLKARRPSLFEMVDDYKGRVKW